MPRISPIIRFGSKILIVGEAPGAREDELGKPFCGASGSELYRMLVEAEIESGTCSLTTVFLDRPPNNDLKHFGLEKKEIEALAKQDPLAKLSLSLGRFNPKLYLKPEKLFELERLYDEIKLIRPNVIIALGNTALWALTGKLGIKTYRGVTTLDKTNTFKVVPTYHPAAILRDFPIRVIAIADLMKAKRESATKELSRLRRDIFIEPSIADLQAFIPEFLSTPILSEDIETKRGQITCISLSPSPTRSLVIPFVDERKPGNSYWATPFEEVQAIEFLRLVNRGPAVKLFQNGIYDVQYLANIGVYPFNWREDTMIMHHSCWAQLPKGLDFLGSVYTDEFSWKKMRTHGRERLKREE